MKPSLSPRASLKQCQWQWQSLPAKKLLVILLVAPFLLYLLVRRGDRSGNDQPAWDNGYIDNVDRDLFRRAMALPSEMTSELAEAPPKVAFLFLVRGPIPLEAAWQRFFQVRARRADRQRFFQVRARWIGGLACRHECWCTRTRLRSWFSWCCTERRLEDQPTRPFRSPGVRLALLASVSLSWLCCDVASLLAHVPLSWQSLVHHCQSTAYFSLFHSSRVPSAHMPSACVTSLSLSLSPPLSLSPSLSPARVTRAATRCTCMLPRPTSTLMPPSTPVSSREGKYQASRYRGREREKERGRCSLPRPPQLPFPPCLSLSLSLSHTLSLSSSPPSPPSHVHSSSRYSPCFTAPAPPCSVDPHPAPSCCCCCCCRCRCCCSDHVGWAQPHPSGEAFARCCAC